MYTSIAVLFRRLCGIHYVRRMSLSRHLCGWMYVTLAALITGCVAFPVPAPRDTVVFGRTVAEDEVRSMVASGEDSRAVRDRLGEPIVSFGPRRVFVYLWTVKKGAIVWLLVGGGAARGGVEPLTSSHLLIIAFDLDGKVLEAGTVEFKPFNTIAKHVRDWLSSVSLTARVASPRLEQLASSGPLLFVYRPSTSPCPFPTFDANIFKPSVAVDGIVVGDLAKGEYLAVEIEAGAHEIAIDPVPYYRFAGQEASFFARDVHSRRVTTTVDVRGDPGRPLYVEAYLCTGMGKTEMHATVRDVASALQTLRVLRPAW